MVGLYVDWEGLDAQKFLRVKIRATPVKQHTLRQVGELIVRLFSVGFHEQRTGYQAHLLSEPTGEIIELALSAELCPGRLGITQILNVLSLPTEYGCAESLFVEQIQLPQIELQNFVGPQLGIEKMRQAFSVIRGPIIGAIIKPVLGREISALVQEVSEVAKSGVDFIVDDELIVDTQSAGFDVRVAKSVDAIAFASKKSKRKVSFVANVTARPSLAVEFAAKAQKAGANGLMTNPIVTGFGALEDLAKNARGMPVFATNIGAALLAKQAFTGPQAGFSEAVISKLTRLAGGDAIHCGIAHADWYGVAPSDTAKTVLNSELGAIKPAFRVVAGGLNIVNMIDNWPYDGEDIIFEAGTSIFAHPDGPSAGAEAFRSAWEVAQTIDLKSDNPKQEAKAALLVLSSKSGAVRHALDAAHWKPDDDVKKRIKSKRARK